MTHAITRRFRRLATAAAATAAAGLMTAGLASGASAAPLPPASHAETFTITFGNAPAGHGAATGPVAGRFRDRETSKTDGTWDFGRFRGRVDVRHTAVPAPPVDPATCAGFAVTGGRWRMQGLSGRYRHAEGRGTFTAYSLTIEGRTPAGACDPGNVLFATTFVTGTGHVRLGDRE